MRKYFCFLLLCLVSLIVVAQENKDLRQIKLKSGLTISGYVTNNPDGSISVTTSEGDQLWYSSVEVQSVIDDPSVAEARKRVEKENNANKDAVKGFHCIFNAGIVDFNHSQHYIKVAPCYCLNEKFTIGIGLGFENVFDDYYSGEEFLIECLIRYSFLIKQFTPFVGFNAGIFDFDYRSLGGEFGLMLKNNRERNVHCALFYNEIDCWGGYLGINIGVTL